MLTLQSSWQHASFIFTQSKVKILRWTTTILAEVLCSLPPSPQADVGISPYITPWQHLSTNFPNHYSLIILLSDTNSRHTTQQKLSLSTQCRHIWGARVQLYSYLTSSSQIHASAALTPGKSPTTHWIGWWMGHKSSLDDLEKRNISCPCRDSETKSSSLQPCHYTNYTILTPSVLLNMK